MNRVEVRRELLRWARERAGLSRTTLGRRFPKVVAWERRSAQPTLKQLEDFARASFTPVGFLFLDAPPVESVPIPDFCTIGNTHIGHPTRTCSTPFTSASSVRSGTATTRERCARHHSKSSAPRGSRMMS